MTTYTLSATLSNIDRYNMSIDSLLVQKLEVNWKLEDRGTPIPGITYISTLSQYLSV